MKPAATDVQRHWRLDDIEFDRIDGELIRHDQFLFVTLASASFVEIHSEKYTMNLVAHFQGNAELTDWLADSWQRDEVQHGQALKAYVQTVWPEFDWERAYLSFSREYDALCTEEQLEQHRALELIARCVVETGTSSFYQAMQNYVKEPVLGALIGKIRVDETSHYRHFRRHFLTYNQSERHGAVRIMQTIWQRLKAVKGEDAYIAFRHVYIQTHPELDGAALQSEWQRYNQTVKLLARRYYPHHMAVKMLVKPVPLSESLKKMLVWPLFGMALLLSYV